MTILTDEEIRAVIEKHALLNAYKYKGVAQTASVMSSIMSTEPNMRRFAKTLKPIVDDAVKKVNAMSIDEISAGMKRTGAACVATRKEEVEGLPPLPGMNGITTPVFRLAPYPSGPLHIGNARMVVLNDEYARMNNGKLILCFDDTIGAMQKDIESGEGKFVLPESYDMIREGLEWLGVKWHQEFYKSDRLPIYYEYAEEVIRMGMTYACNCDAETFRELKNAGKPCPHHDMPAGETFDIFENMVAGKYKEGEVVIRMKTGLDLPDPALREPVIMRISYANHPRVGKKYAVWPMLEFSWGIDDHLFKITHIIRGKDLVKEDFIERFIWKLFGWKPCTIIHFGILLFEGIKLSKTHARRAIESEEYSGWDDPRTWSLQSLARRGFDPLSLRRTLLSMKLSMNDISFPYEMLYCEDKKLVDKKSVSVSFIPDPVRIDVVEIPRERWDVKTAVNAFDKASGSRESTVAAVQGKISFYVPREVVGMLNTGQPIRLKDLFNAALRGDRIVFHSKNPADVKNGKNTVPWVDASRENSTDVHVFMPDGSVVNGKGESFITGLQENQVVYFDRFGFARIDDVSCDGVIAWFAH